MRRLLVLMPFLLAGCFFPVGGCYYPDQAAWEDDTLYDVVGPAQGVNYTAYTPSGSPLQNASAPGAVLQSVRWSWGSFPTQVGFTLQDGTVRADGWTAEGDTDIEEPFRRFVAWLLEADNATVDAWAASFRDNTTAVRMDEGHRHPGGDDVTRYRTASQVDVHGPYRIEAFRAELEAVGWTPQPSGAWRLGSSTHYSEGAGPWDFGFAVPYRSLTTAEYNLTVGSHGVASFSGSFGDEVDSDAEYVEVLNAVLASWGLPPVSEEEVNIGGAIC